MKKKFLRELGSYLGQLSYEERQEIIRFYEERFETSMRYEGKSEEEVIDELESPRQIARNVLEEYGYDSVRMTTVSKDKEPSVKTGSVVGLILFDVFIATVIIPLLFGLFTGFAGGFIGFIGSIFASLFIDTGIQTPWGFIIAAGVAYLWLLVVFWLYDLFVGFVIWLVRWHLSVFKMMKSSKLVKSLKRFQISTFLKRSPGLKRLKNFLAFVAFICIIGGSLMAITTTGTLGFGSWNEPLETIEYSQNVSEDIVGNNTWSITSNLELGNVRIIRNGGESINIISKERESVPVTVTINEEEKTIHLENRLPRIVFDFNFLRYVFDDHPGVTIEIPEGIDLSSIQLDGINGEVVIDGFDLEEIHVKSTNALITLRNLNVATDIHVRTTNGAINVRSVTAQTIDVRSTNGLVSVRNVEAATILAQTTNGEVQLTDVNVDNQDGVKVVAKTTNGKVRLTEVYVLDVELQTTNGSIEYTNTDLTFILDRLVTKVTNGSVDKNVPVKP